MKKAAIICPYPLPHGMAATTRLMSYSKGLNLNNTKVEVYSYIPSGDKYSNHPADSGIFDGVSYFYSFRKKRFNNKALHIIEIIISLFLTYVIIKRKNKQSPYDFIIISNDNPIILYLYSILSKNINVKSLFIFDEYPIPIRKYLKSNISLLKKYLYKISLKNISGYISMTQNLIDYYDSIQKKPSLLINSITDLSRFDFDLKKTIEVNKKDEIILTYMGNMELSKDNVDNIIKAFAITLSKYQTSKLYLYGSPSQKDKEFLSGLIKKLKLENNVFFKFATFIEVPIILKKSHVLLSSQPNTKRAEGGFPTKVGEYLASGIPTLLTDVGETSKYVKNNEHIFFCEPDSPEEFSSKLNYIIENYDYACSVALKGKALIVQEFSNTIAAKKMLEFINNIKKI
jgi:glycosyltransferase involved in cell wall biosynthesis